MTTFDRIKEIRGPVDFIGECTSKYKADQTGTSDQIPLVKNCLYILDQNLLKLA